METQTFDSIEQIMEDARCMVVDLDRLYDVCIIGAGPAGLTAAINLGRANLSVVVVEHAQFGGQITKTNEVINYPGVFNTSGTELTGTMYKQAESFGAVFLCAEATGLNMNGDIKTVNTSGGDVRCKAVLIASGSVPRMGGFEGESKFKNKGIFYNAVRDARKFEGMHVFVVGGGFAAAEEAMYLAQFARKVTLCVRRDSFSCAASVVERVMNDKKVDVRFNTEIIAVGGDPQLSWIIYRDTATGEVHRFEEEAGQTFGIFVFVGYGPSTSFANKWIELDERGYIITDSNHMTLTPGLFAAGDVTAKRLRQVTTAVGEAADAAANVEDYLKSL